MANYMYLNIKKYTDELLKTFPPPPPPPFYGAPTPSTSTSTSPSPPLPPGSTSPSAHSIGSSNVSTGKRIVSKLMTQLGITQVQAAALTGNFYAESGFIPSILQGKRSGGFSLSQAISGGYSKLGYGFAQWTYVTRQKSLNKFLDSKYGAGRGATHIMTEDDNIEFVVYELNTPSFKSILNKLKTFSSISDATIYVMKHYEQPADQSPTKQAERIGYAKQVL